MKTCRKCLLPLEEAQFYGAGGGYLRGECKSCTNSKNKAWAAENPGARKRIANRYAAADYRKRPDAHRGASRAWYHNNVTTAKARNAQWRAAHPEQAAASVTRWRVENPDRVRASKRADYVRNKSVYIARAVKYAADKDQRYPMWDRELTDFVTSEAGDLCKRMESLTGNKYEIDHDVPLRGDLVSGLHVWNNLRVLPRAVNRRKSNSFDIL